MTTHDTHPGHQHQHGADCGHIAIKHETHVDYVHDGHLHRMHGDHVDEHVLPESAASEVCSGQNASGHPAEHHHGADCGHERVPHGDHVDYLVGSHLHHEHAGHCDEHGAVTLA